MKTKVKLSWHFYDPKLRFFSLGIEMDCSTLPKLGEPRTPMAVVNTVFSQQVLRFSQTLPIDVANALINNKHWSRRTTMFAELEDDIIAVARLHAFDAGFDARGLDLAIEYEPFNGTTPNWVHMRDSHDFTHGAYGNIALFDGARLVKRFDCLKIRSVTELMHVENQLVDNGALEFLKADNADPVTEDGDHSDSE